METIGAYEAKTHLPRLLNRVSRGEKIIGSPKDVVIHLIPALEISAGLYYNHVKTNFCQGEQKCRPVPAAALRRS